jgi:hypothetical protein
LYVFQNRKISCGRAASRLMARCAPYDSRRLATRFAVCPRGRPWQGKGNAAAYRRLFTPPVASLPKSKSRGQSRPQNLMLIRMRFTTPGHSRTAQRGGYASGISAAGVAFVAEVLTADMRHSLSSGLPAMNRYGLFNPSVPASSGTSRAKEGRSWLSLPVYPSSNA